MLRSLRAGFLGITNRRLIKITAIISFIYLVVLAAHLIIIALFSGTYIQTYAADGTFQLYNPLRRLFDGQTIGKDFPFFHGVGVPILHYPFFILFGHNLFAAETAKWLVTPVLFFVTSLLFFAAYFKNVKKTLISTAVFSLFAFQFINVVFPGNSLVGVRTTFPVLAGAFMLWRPVLMIRIRSLPFSFYKPVLFLLLALAVACGTEQGLAAITAYGILEFIKYARSTLQIRRWLMLFLGDMLAIAATVFLVITILTTGHPLQALHYALIDIPKDQGWYFGAPPNEFLSIDSLSLLVDKYFLPMGGTILLGLGLLYFVMKRSLIKPDKSYVAQYYILYGLIVFVVGISGYFAPSAQLIPLHRVLALFMAAILFEQWVFGKSKNKNIIASNSTRYVLLAITAVILLYATVITAHDTTRFQIINILKLSKHARNNQLDTGSLSAQWQKRVTRFQPFLQDNPSLWSTYTSVYDSVNGTLSSSRGGEDYIIHALGKERRESYEKDFINQRPSYVITLKPTYFRYEEWLWIRHWSFYKQLFENYEIVADNDAHVLWKYQVGRQKAHVVPINLRNDQNGEIKMTFPKSSKVQLYEINVSYKAHGAMPTLNKFPRYMIRIESSEIQRFDISLPAYQTTWSFPVVVAPGQTSITLRPYTTGITVASTFNIQSAVMRPVELVGNNDYIFYDSYCSFGGMLDYDDMHEMMRCKLSNLTIEHYKKFRPSELFTTHAQNRGKLR